MSDYIERYAAIEEIKEIDPVEVITHGNNAKLNIGAVLERLVRLPSADLEPIRHGRWIDNGDFVMCSCCTEFYVKRFNLHRNYCPNCGARMDGDKK